MSVATSWGARVRLGQLVVFVAAAATFAWLAWLIGAHGRPEWADPVLHWVGRMEASPFEALMIGFAFLGAGFGLVLLLTGVLFVLWRANRRRDVAFVAASLLVAQVIGRIVKGEIAEPRPTPADIELIHGLADVRRVVLVLVLAAPVAALATPWRRPALVLGAILGGCYLFYEMLAPAVLSAGDYGFPSGHATGSMSLAAAVVVVARPTRWAIRALVVGGLFVIGVGFSRLSFGVHYPTDVLGGWLLALAAVVATRVALPATAPPDRVTGSGHRAIT